ncbi:MAG: putative cell shape-determining protein [Pseudomonadota bacterium]|jgi:rod shape-determining protein MreC
MPLGTLDTSPPPIFKQGTSAISKMLVFSALAGFLMVADVRLHITQPLRMGISTVLYPVQWLALQPVRIVLWAGDYITSLDASLERTAVLEKGMAEQTQRASRVEQLQIENNQLRQLLQLQANPSTSGQAAQVMYDAPDPYTHKVIIDKGLAHSVELGSPVVGPAGVVGQVTRVNAISSEVTLLIDREQSIPVLNARSGQRSIVYGDPNPHGNNLEMRFMAANADVLQGDLLTTSGVDGVYPAGLHVARVSKIERRADTAFARIYCEPIALMHGARHVMVLKPVTVHIPPRQPEPPSPVTGKGARK